MTCQNQIMKQIAWHMLQPHKEWHSLSELEKVCDCEYDDLISVIICYSGLFDSRVITTKKKKNIAKFSLKNPLLLRTVFYTNQMCGNPKFKFEFSEKEWKFLKALSNPRFTGQRSVDGIKKETELSTKEIKEISYKFKESNIISRSENLISFTNIGRPLYGMLIIHFLFFESEK